MGQEPTSGRRRSRDKLSSLLVLVLNPKLLKTRYRVLGIKYEVLHKVL